MDKKMETPKAFDKAREAAEKLSQEQDKVQKMLEQALQKAEEQKKNILNFWDGLQLLMKMVRSYFNKEYTSVPWKTIVFAVAGIIYFLNPLDLIPDLIPALGFLDDAIVIAFVLNALKEDMERFKHFTEQSVSIE